MKEHGLIFQAPLVRAILSGQKTMTRRPLYVRRKASSRATFDNRYPPPYALTEDGWPNVAPGECWTLNPMRPQVGDVVWGREAHWYFKDECDPSIGYSPPPLTADDVKYLADGESKRHGWYPSIHMPRWAARIVLPVTRVRVERLKAITQADAMAEGVWTAAAALESGVIDRSPGGGRLDHVGAFLNLWDSIYGDVELNPWVQVIEWAPFKRIDHADQA